MVLRASEMLEVGSRGFGSVNSHPILSLTGFNRDRMEAAL